MTTFCPRCGQAGRDEAVVTPLVAVWASCESCHFVWRSSLFDTMKDFAARGARRSLGETVADRYSPAATVQVATDAPVSLEPASADRVAEWLASQEESETLKLAPIVLAPTDVENGTDPVEEFLDRLEPAEIPTVAQHDVAVAPVENDFYSFFNDDDAVVPEHYASVEQPAEEPLAVAVAEPIIEPIVESIVEPILEPVIEPIVAATITTPLENSVDRALTNVEDLYDAFKRLEQQLGGMEKWCAELAK